MSRLPDSCTASDARGGTSVVDSDSSTMNGPSPTSPAARASRVMIGVSRNPSAPKPTGRVRAGGGAVREAERSEAGRLAGARGRHLRADDLDVLPRLLVAVGHLVVGVEGLHRGAQVVVRERQ